jgi:hypothetical protein
MNAAAQQRRRGKKNEAMENRQQWRIAPDGMIPSLRL